MLREEPRNEQDSGWEFFAGDEDEEYTHDPDNCELCVIETLLRIDPTILSYLDSPVGASFVRVASDEFEPDHNQPGFMEKWR